MISTKHDSLKRYRIVFYLLIATALAASVSYAQCPPQGYPDYTVDCANGYCCPTNLPVCCNAVSIGWCCPQGTECCLDQLGNPDCCPSGQTTTVPAATSTTSTITDGGATTTAPGGGGNAYIAAVNITGSGEQDAPQSSGTMPGTSPSEAGPLMTYEGTGKPMHLIIKDRFFSQLDKKLYERTLEEMKADEITAGPRVTTHALGDVKQFWVKDDKDFTWRKVTATSKKEGLHSIIYVDNTLNMADADLETYVTEFEEMFAIISNNIGTFSDRDGNGKINILIYDINDGASVSTGWLAGYFWSKDYINDSQMQSQGVRSNEADMIYIRGDAPGGWTTQYGDFADTTLTTLIHEYQHMVNFCITYWQPQQAGQTGNFADTWINEMMSMASETMYFKKKLADNPSYTYEGMLPGGYLEDRIGYYNKDPKNSIRNGHGLCYWDNNGDVFSNYSLAYIFGQYLSIQSSSGQAIYKEILDYMKTSSVYDYQTVAAVAKQRLPGIGSWEDLIKNWAIANMLNQTSGAYGYKGAFSLTPHGPTSAVTTLHSGGIAYRLVDENWSRPADAGASVKYFGFSTDEVPSTSTIPAAQTTTSTVSGTNTTTASTGTTTIPLYTCPLNYPIDCGNGYCCPSNLPVCGTGASEGQCLSRGLCATSLMFGDASYEANLLRTFRDQVLARTGNGTELSNLYYQHTGELVAIIFGDTVLYKDVMDVTGQMIPVVESALEGSEITIDMDVEYKIDQLCERMGRKASPDLRQAIDKIREALASGQLLRELGLKK